MDSIQIQYKFTLEDGEDENFDLNLDAKNLGLINSPVDNPPAWTELDYLKCEHCPLSSKDVPHCPLALNLTGVVDSFKKLISYDSIRLQVTTVERVIIKETTAQKALSSLMGLIIATSDCPHTIYFKPMARFHLPLADRAETAYRATSMYLLAQYFLKKDGQKTDLDLEGLTKIYKNLEKVNHHTAKRLRSACQADAAINAITLLDTYTKTMPFMIGDSLENIKYLFEPFFKNID